MKTKLLAILALLVAATSAQAQVIPTGLNPGDQFRYAFITSTETDAISMAIADYNNFVMTAANNNMDIFNQTLSPITFNAIASTNTVDAIDNTGTDAMGVDVPIYLLDGTQVATGNADFWDSSILAAINVDESLNTINDNAWTGSFADGTSAGSFGLGDDTNNLARVGFSSLTDDRWAFDNVVSTGVVNHLYGLSDPITVGVPEPATSAIAIFAGLGLLGLRRRSA